MGGLANVYPLRGHPQAPSSALITLAWLSRSQEPGVAVEKMSVLRMNKLESPQFRGHNKTLNTLRFVTSQGKMDKALQLHVRATEIREGPDSVKLATVLFNRATWLEEQVRVVIFFRNIVVMTCERGSAPQ